MIKTITIVNHIGNVLTLDLNRPENSGLAITHIDGIGPGKANINVVEMTSIDGGIIGSTRRDSRNIVFTFKLLAHPTIEDTRLMTYRYFPLKKKIKLIFETDRRSVEIDGYVESNEPNIFSGFETTSISIICPDPNFHSYGKGGIKVVPFSSVEALFEFPFSNESVTSKMLEFGTVGGQETKTIIYEGDEDTGFTIRLHALGTIRDFTIFNLTTDERLVINIDRLIRITGNPIISGDEIVICSERGRKSLTLIRSGEHINILDCLTSESSWFKLNQGENIFAYDVKDGSQNVELQFEYRTIYEGV